MVCANATGTERCRLLVVGKSAKPRCFKGMKTLPVDHIADKKSWMTMDIFSDWVRTLDGKFATKSRNVLFVDNCTAHCDVEGLRAIRLVFPPKNTTAVLPPMDMGVIQNLKTLQAPYRGTNAIVHGQRQNMPSTSSALSISLPLRGPPLSQTPSATVSGGVRLANPRPVVMRSDEAVQTSSDDDDNCVSERGISVHPNGVTFEGYVNVDAGVEICGVTGAETLQATCPQQSASGDPLLPVARALMPATKYPLPLRLHQMQVK